MKLEHASIMLMFNFVESHLAAGRSVIVESNFYPELDGPRVRALQKRYDSRVFEVHCDTELDLLIVRFRRRQGSSERHPGHVKEACDLAELEAYVASGFFRTLDLKGKLLTVATTDFERVDYDAILSAVRSPPV